jgi:hypothetical protein
VIVAIDEGGVSKGEFDLFIIYFRYLSDHSTVLQLSVAIVKEANNFAGLITKVGGAYHLISFAAILIQFSFKQASSLTGGSCLLTICFRH